MKPFDYHRFLLGNTGVTTFIEMHGMLKLATLNDYSHLSIDKDSHMY